MSANNNKRIYINDQGSRHFHVPDLLEIQLESYYSFMQADCDKKDRKRSGLQEVFLETFPIKDYTENIILEFLDYDLGHPPAKGCPSLDPVRPQKCLMEECPACSKAYVFYKFRERSYRLKSTPEECQKRDGTYGIPLNMRVRLINKLSGELKEQEIFVLNMPLMTKRGTFIINGAERVIVSQLHRSPGVYFEYNKTKKLYQGKIVPYRGSWLEFQLDVMKDLFHVEIDRKRKVPATLLLRVMGFSEDQMLQEIDHGGTLKYIQNTLKVDKTDSEEKSLEEIFRRLRPGEPFIYENAKTMLDGLYSNPKRYDLGSVGRYKFNQKVGFTEKLVGQRIAENLYHPEDLRKLFFSANSKDKPFSYAEAKKLAEEQQSNPKPALKPIVCDGDTLTPKIVREIEKLKIPRLNILTADDILLDVVRPKISWFVDMEIGEGLCQSLHEGLCVSGDITDTGTNEVILRDGEPLTNEIIFRLNERKDFLLQIDADSWMERVPAGMVCLYKGNVLDKEDILHAMKYIVDLSVGVGFVDDIDHLGHRRVRRVGELLKNQFRISFSRMERVIRDRMTLPDAQSITPQFLINVRPIVSSIEEFFGSSQLSQFMDQVNPLSELTHKRKLSALGPGGLKRERAGFEVRDVHPTHFGRICPIETPEGQNAGLIGALSLNAKINRYGFIITPLRAISNGRASLDDNDPIEFYDALQEEKHRVVTYNQGLYTGTVDSESILPIKQYTESEQDFVMRPAREAELIHVSPLQMISAAATLIPFIEHDDANRALMGTSMQRQSVPLVHTESPIVGTGMESYIASNSGVCLVSEFDGIVDYVDAQKIVVKRTRREDCVDVFGPDGYKHAIGRELVEDVKDAKGKVLHKQGYVLTETDVERMFNAEFTAEIKVFKEKSDTYHLRKYSRSNQGTCLNQKPCVKMQEEVVKGQVLADGPSVNNGEISLGRNVMCAFMPFRGYNFEDAIVLSERLVYEDVYTSVHINQYEIEARDTKLGAEEITRDIPNIGDDMKKNLDEDGIVRVGAEVKPGDILVGKITPKGEAELTAEDKLLRAIFGEKAKEVRNTSLTVPHGEKGKVIGVMMFSREKGDELPYGVNKLVRVFLAQRRVVSEGDKMAGRHGNKGVISKIFPIRDMPFLADGQPVDVVLNPLGVPSRMNVGQVLETHLGWVGKRLNEKYATSAFNAGNSCTNEQFVRNRFALADIPDDGMVTLYDGETGEPYDARIVVGYMYMLKLIHLVEDKIHARSTGPYSLVTQQPLGGKAQFGGQRFGEMEVWALEAYGAAHVLRELLTIKSDDVEGRVTVYEMIVKGNNMMTPNIPESFKVIVSELKSLGLNIEFNQEQ